VSGILLQAAARAIADQRTVSGLLCPSCAGGATKEHSVSVWPEDRGAAWHCWRNKCGRGGRLFPDGSVPSGTHAPHKACVRLPDCEALSETAVAYLWTRYGIRQTALESAGVMQRANYLAMPVRSPRGDVRGYNLRRLWGAGRKADSVELERPWMAWLRVHDCRATVVVEDQLSALRLAQLGFEGVALLGTSLSLDKLTEIKRNCRQGEFVLALDADATRRALSYAKRFGFRIVRLDRDFKDCEDDEIVRTISP
jgi:hypothetical protein